MGSAKEYQTDARYYLTLALSMIDDLCSYASIVGYKRGELNKASTEESSSLANSLDKLLKTWEKKSEFKHTVQEAEKELQTIFGTLDKADKLDPNARIGNKGAELSSTDLRATAYSAAGYGYMRANELKQALKAFEKSYNSKPDQSALSSYALALERKGGWGSKAKVKEALQKVVEFDPYSELGLAAAKKLVRM